MPARRSSGLLSIYPHITTRDRELLGLLDDHQVLTTDQVHRLLFQAQRTCQLRLNELRQIGLVERFRFARSGGGSQPWHWVLAHDGERFQAAARNRAEPTVRSSQQRITRLSANPHLHHLVAANDFFVRLASYARRHPDVRLDRWWSETQATKQFRVVRPDGHGVWTCGDVSSGFWLEVDTGSEPLGRVVAKLDAYVRLAATGGPAYPVLFWLPGEAREENLHRLLRTANARVAAATAVHAGDPSDAVWLSVGGMQRVRIGQLPSDHGRSSAANPNFIDGVLALTGETEV